MDQYEEIKLIGKGAYGKVFKVRSKSEGEIYVIKKVQFDGTPQSEAESALREGQVLSLLRHPHVVPYKELFKHSDGDLCLVMAYCEGGDLFRYIRELRKHGKTVPEPEVWQWLVQLLLSLSYIHSKRILHRDVKTQNIFLSDGKVLLGDFGLAKQLQRTFEMARTPIGTPYYMAPEIYEEQPYSFKSDVWALGCVMYEMMTGRPAFAADNLSRVVLRVIRGQYDPLPDTYSEELRAVVVSMLCKDVRTRPDANELLIVPAVVPHVQSYLESLTAEGPAGWATWRMKLPLMAVVQMTEALEAAGIPATGSGRQLQKITSVSPSRTSDSSVADSDPGAVPPEQYAAASPPATPAQCGSRVGVTEGRVVQLPPLPGVKPPPKPVAPRTNYGLPTPFMGGVPQPTQQYAELQMLAQQMLAIRTSQCGDMRSGKLSLTGAVAVASAASASAPAAVSDEVKALDSTLIRTLELARKAAANHAPVDNQHPPVERTGGVDEDWLSAGLPQGGFGFGGGEPKSPSSSEVVLPRIQTPRRAVSAQRQSQWAQQPQKTVATSEPQTPAVAAPARTGVYHIPDEGYASLNQVTLHAQSLIYRRANIEQYCEERLGKALMGQVMQAVNAVQEHSRAGGDMEAAEAQLRLRLDSVLGAAPDGPRLRQELGPLIEELALLQC